MQMRETLFTQFPSLVYYAEMFTRDTTTNQIKYVMIDNYFIDEMKSMCVIYILDKKTLIDLLYTTEYIYYVIVLRNTWLSIKSVFFLLVETTFLKRSLEKGPCRHH